MSGPRTLSPPFRPGDVLGGRYELQAMLDQGGMSEVYLALDRLLDRRVVVKTPRVGLLQDPGLLARFRREARALAGLSHPGLVTIHDAGFEGASPYLVEELVEGSPLSRVISALRSLPPHRGAEIAAEVAEGLAYAHERGIVHRDVKPGNIMLCSSGAVKVLDFGIAWAPWWTPLTETTEVRGTAPYLSPEQAQGDPVDARSDVYSLGVVMFEMLSGAPPFLGESPLALARRHLEEAPPELTELNPAVPTELSQVVERCLAKRPEDRYPSARALAAELRTVMERGPGAAPTIELRGPEPTAVMPAEPALHRRPWRRAAAAMAVVLVAATVWSMGGGLLAGHPRAAAAPVAPRGLRATPHCEGFLAYGVSLRWRPSPSAGSYLVLRRSPGGGFDLVGRVRGRNAVNYEDGGLEGGTPYEYGIRAVLDRRESGLSGTVLASTNRVCFS